MLRNWPCRLHCPLRKRGHSKMGPNHGDDRTQTEICGATLPTAQQGIRCYTFQQQRKEHRKHECSPTALQAHEQGHSIHTVTHRQLHQAQTSCYMQLHSGHAYKRTYKHTKYSRIPLRAQQVFTPLAVATMASTMLSLDCENYCTCKVTHSPHETPLFNCPSFAVSSAAAAYFPAISSGTASVAFDFRHP